MSPAPRRRKWKSLALLETHKQITAEADMMDRRTDGEEDRKMMWLTSSHRAGRRRDTQVDVCLYPNTNTQDSAVGCFFCCFFYLLAGADGRSHGALRASSLHLDWLGAFKHGRRLEVTARQKRAGSWVCQSKFLSNTLKKVGDQWGRVWREQPIPCHACSFCATEALFIGISWTATVGQENYFNIISIWY